MVSIVRFRVSYIISLWRLHLIESMPMTGTSVSSPMSLMKKIISVSILCLSGLLVLHLEPGNTRVILAVWLSLTMAATVLLFGEKEGPRLYVQRRPTIR
jgi:hypothetical protein